MRRWILALFVLWACPSAAADDAPLPKIREFDLAMEEKLGRAMYDQDEEAWKATDILTERHPQKELVASKLRGWIVVPHPEGDVVRFVHITDRGPELFYDVTFPKNGAPVLSEPADRALMGVERAMYDARTLALEKTQMRCGENLNTILLKDPERSGWLVWVMSATTDPNLIITAGHTRFTISADGKTIEEADKLSTGCRNFPKHKQVAGEEANLVLTQAVAVVPVETYIFASLSYRIVLRLGTPDGMAWKINADMVTPLDMDMPGVDGYAARAVAAFDEVCGAMVPSSTKPDKFDFDKIDSVIRATEEKTPYEAKPPSGLKPTAVMCGRNDFVPAPNDYKVVLAGLPLYIKDRGTGHPERFGALELQGGEIRYRQIDGDKPDAALEQRIKKRLETLQAALSASPH